GCCDRHSHWWRNVVVLRSVTTYDHGRWHVDFERNWHGSDPPGRNDNGTWLYRSRHQRPVGDRRPARRAIDAAAKSRTVLAAVLPRVRTQRPRSTRITRTASALDNVPRLLHQYIQPPDVQAARGCRTGARHSRDPRSRAATDR